MKDDVHQRGYRVEEERPYKPLLSYSKTELVAYFGELGFPSYRADQVLRWIFSRKTGRFSQMTDLSKDARTTLTRIFSRPEERSVTPAPLLIRDDSQTVAAPDDFDAADSLFEGRLVAKSISSDGSEKLLIEWRDGRRVECALLRDDRDHRTACVSVQVGCAMGCAFCASGLGGFVRNLTTSEILEQLLRLNALTAKDERLTHIVVMGTGEPTLNLDALLPALEVATSSDGLDVGNRRVTISTVGIPAGIRRLASAKVPYKLAVSLHAPNDRIRDQIMPQNRVHPIAETLAAADFFFHSTGRRVTFEYILLDGINASPDNAYELARLLKNRTAIVNAIPYNPSPEFSFRTPSNATIRRFVTALEESGIQVKVRFKKGDRINAACGQLRWSLRDR